MNNETPLIIIGMHRSGTSFAASWIDSLGLNLGDNLLGAGIGNNKGHFEDMDFHDMHEAIFRLHDIDYGGLRLPISFTISDDEKKSMDEVLAIKGIGNKQWGWKEPRTCLFLDYYKMKFPKAKYFVMYRNCDDVIDSLLRRDIKMFDKRYPAISLIHKIKYHLRKKTYHKNVIRFNKENYKKVWLIYTEKIKELLKELNSDDYIVCDHASLIKNDKEIFSKLMSWKYELNYSPISHLFEKDLFKAPIKTNKNEISEIGEMNAFFYSKINANPN